MKFKKVKGESYHRIDIPNKDGEMLRIETKGMSYFKPGLFIEIHDAHDYTIATTDLSRAKALKLAWAIIEHYQPDWETAF